MSAVTLPPPWASFCESANPELIHGCVDGIFRRLLANLLLDYTNARFRQVKSSNKALQHYTHGFPDDFITFLFQSLGFVKREDSFIFDGTPESLKHGDAILSLVENTVDKKMAEKAEREMQHLKNAMAQRTKKTVQVLDTKTTAAGDRTEKNFTDPRALLPTKQISGLQQDFSEAEPLKQTARMTLLNTGRVRNSFFEAKDFTLRTMNNGRVYACSQKCVPECLEAHWHILTGRNIVYSHLAHLSPDGSLLLHLGPEHGYQYNSLPGTPNFRKMIHFSEKMMDHEGRLAQAKTDDKVVTNCIYCGRLFSEILL